MATRTPLEEALAFFDGAAQLKSEIPSDAFPASVLAREARISTRQMRDRIAKRVALGEVEVFEGVYGPSRVPTRFYRPKK
jgi:hypothetical protein